MNEELGITGKLETMGREPKGICPDALSITRHSRRRGQMLVELMVAMSIMVVGMLGIFAVLSESLALNRIAANQYIAAHLAAEGVEVTKNILDMNFINGRRWNQGFAANGNYGVQFDSTSLDPSKATTPLRFSESTGRYSYNSGTQTQFRRTVTINNVSADEIKVVSRVFWTDRGGIDFEVDVEDRFRNWRD